VEVHTSVQRYNVDFEVQLKRKNFSTPKNYLDFLNNYRTGLSFNKNKFIEMAKRYKDGLEKLVEAKEQVEQLRAELEIKQT
jgi:dynein heavy chain